MSAKKKAKKKRPKKAAGKKAAGKKKTKKPSPAKRRKKPSKKRPAKRSPPAALPARRTPVGALTRPGVTSKAAEALFPPEEIERLKLVVLTSARREEKIEALRRLAYSPLDVDRKAELFLNRLADRDAEVRVEAAQLLRILGLDPEVAASIRDLELGDEAQRLFAIARLGRRMAKGDPLDAGAALIAFTWRLREEGTAAVRRPLIERLEAAAPGLVRAGPSPVYLLR